MKRFALVAAAIILSACAAKEEAPAADPAPAMAPAPAPAPAPAMTDSMAKDTGMGGMAHDSTAKSM